MGRLAPAARLGAIEGHVAPRGDGGNPGPWDHPVATLNGARNAQRRLPPFSEPARVRVWPGLSVRDRRGPPVFSLDVVKLEKL